MKNKKIKLALINPYEYEMMYQANMERLMIELNKQIARLYAE